VEAGYAPEMAYFECLHEVKLIVDAVFISGISGMHRRVSDTAEYGDYTRGRRVISKAAREEMKKILKEIQSGSFAREWMEENKKGRPNFNRMREECDNHPVEKVGAELRKMMPWIQGEEVKSQKAQQSTGSASAARPHSQTCATDGSAASQAKVKSTS
jgi:ketol-acid reductoisomerase